MERELTVRERGGLGEGGSKGKNSDTCKRINNKKNRVEKKLEDFLKLQDTNILSG